MPHEERIELVTLNQLLQELGEPDKPLARSTFHDWETQGKAPKGFRIPNGQLRFRRTAINAWIQEREATSYEH